MTHVEQLQADGTAQFENEDWGDEQDRSDWFEGEAYKYAALADELTLSDDARALIAKLLDATVDIDELFAPDGVWDEARAAFPNDGRRR